MVCKTNVFQQNHQRADFQREAKNSSCHCQSNNDGQYWLRGTKTKMSFKFFLVWHITDLCNPVSDLPSLKKCRSSRARNRWCFPLSEWAGSTPVGEMWRPAPAPVCLWAVPGRPPGSWLGPAAKGAQTQWPCTPPPGWCKWYLASGRWWWTDGGCPQTETSS